MPLPIVDLSLAVAHELLRGFNNVFEAMTPEQKQYWIQKGIANDKAVEAWVRDVFTKLGIPLPTP